MVVLGLRALTLIVGVGATITNWLGTQFFCGTTFKKPSWGTGQGGSKGGAANDEPAAPSWLAGILELLGDKSPDLTSALQKDFPALKPQKPQRLSQKYAEATGKVASALRAREKALENLMYLKEQCQKVDEALIAACAAHVEAVDEAESLKEEMAAASGVGLAF